MPPEHASKPFSAFPQTPSFSAPPKPLTCNFPQSQLDRIQRRLDDAEDIRATYENSFSPEEDEMGMRKSWMDAAIAHWRSDFDWRRVEEEINRWGHWTVSLKAREHEQTIHFMGLFSEMEGAVPVIMTHGWPGSFMEFLPLFAHLASTYTPQTLPVHLVVPSLPGYGFSGPVPRHDRFSNLDTATLWNELMLGLGFKAYAAQGGDVGSRVTRLLARDFEACKAIHLNTFHMSPPDQYDISSYDTLDQSLIGRVKYFNAWEYAYKHEHATKPSTIAMCVGADPVALLAWIGEKFLRWSDEDPSMDTILAGVTLYWLTGCFATGMYTYWSTYGPKASDGDRPGEEKRVPVGYSLFPKDINPLPIEWVGTVVGLVWSKRHEEGGHFAALEKPQVLWEDFSDFLKVAWKPSHA